MTAPFVVATYNVHAWRGTDGRFAPERCLRVVEELDVDLIGLQEVTTVPALPGSAALAQPHRDLPAHEPAHTEALLEHATRLQAVSGPTMQRADGRFGNLLLTRHPVLAVRRHDLSVRQHEPRGALDVDVRIHGAVVRVLVTHLGLNPAERKRQALHLVSLLERSRADDLVLLGDLNQWFPWWGSLRPLQRWFREAPYRRTFPSRWPLFPLDRVLVNPYRHLETLEVHRSPLARVASDHLPLRATIRPLGA